MAKTTIAGILVVMLFVCGGTAYAATPCVDENGNRVACEQMPPPEGGGPGGGTCWAMTCTKCVEVTHPVLPDIKWDTCKTVAENGGCNCNWAGDKCTGPYGSCVYTG